MSQSKDQGERGLSLSALWELFGRNLALAVTTLAAFVVGSVIVLASREPSFRARASLILDDEAGAAGVLGELALLGKAPAASSQIELLRARSTAEETIAEPTTRVGEFGHAEDVERHLGLTTLVEDPLLRPLDELAFSDEVGGKFPARLRASIECDDEFGGAREFEVEFTSASAVRVRESRVLGRGADIEAELGTQALEVAGVRLRLEPEGDLTGRSFRVRRLTRAEAVERVLGATRVRETERNSGVIELSYDDSDPRRAAEIANALCRNYLARSEARGQRRASQTVEFIETSLTSQSASLKEAETEVVELQRAKPRAIDVGKTAEALILQSSQLEVQRVQAEFASVAARQALERLDSGDVDAFSRLSLEIGDPITATYLEGLAKLSAESALQERSDAGAYKALLQQRALELEAQLDRTDLDAKALEAALGALAAGDSEAVARFGGGAPAALDPLLDGVLATLSALQSRKSALQVELTADHPDRLKVDEQIAATHERIRVLLSARLEGRLAQRVEQQRLLDGYRRRTASYPLGERAHIDDALVGLRTRTAAHLNARLRGLEQSREMLSAQIARLQSDLGTLPEDARAIAEPMRRSAAHGEIVKFLLAKKQEAEITKAATVASAEFIDVAVPPTERSSPSIPLHLAAGLLLGICAAFALAFTREALSRSVFTLSELEEATELAVLGTIPDFRRGRYKTRGAGRHHLPLRDDPEGATAEAYRSLRANLKFAFSSERDVRVIAATSCTQGEGKSSTNLSLAMSFAKSGRRVIVLDCDMRVPSVDKYLGLPLSPGLSEVLQSKCDWHAALHTNVVERLDVLTAGAQPASPSDLLDAQEFRRLLERLRRDYDLVVCDVPPAHAVADLESVVTQIDGVLIVVRSNKVSARTIAESVKRLKQSGAHLVGAVLNGVGSSIVNGRFGNEYGYGYGKRSDKQQRDAG